MKTATPQETYDHMLGAGATQYSWWLDLKNVTGVDKDGNVTSDWNVTLVGEGDDKPVSATISHKAVMKAAHRIIGGAPVDAQALRFVSSSCRRECSALIFDPDDTDFDAATSDEVLQVIVFGEVVFG